MTSILESLFTRYPSLRDLEQPILAGYGIIRQALEKRRTLFLCGNGGSAADAEHMAGELLKGFLLPRHADRIFRKKLEEQYGNKGLMLAEGLQEGFKTITLNSHPSFATAFGNDVNFETIFAQQLYVLGEEGDVLIGFTTSGNSENVLNAFRVAGAAGISTIALTGQSGGKSADIADCCIRVPETETYKVQELHLPVYHALCAMLEDDFYGG